MGLTKSSTGINAKDSFLDNFPKSDITVALAGNPNVGKSSLFNHITGMHQHTGNWPGKTVTGAVGCCTYNEKKVAFVDLPGCYSLLAHSPEEEVARDYIKSDAPDVTIIVCDATCLERNLILALQTLEITHKVILCINLIDEAEKKGIKINSSILSENLGIPVVLTSARKGVGVEKLLELICTYKFEENAVPTADATQNIKRAEQLVKSSVVFKKKNHLLANSKADKILTGTLAFPTMLVLLLGVFWLTITGANGVSDVLSSWFFKTEEWLNYILLQLGVPTFFRELFIFGGFRMLIWVVSVMLPPMAIFFPLFTLLEDLGYLPRIAFNLDRCFKACGACGKQALTMCMGFGCNAAGVVGARIIDSKRERLIAIITNSLVPCNGRFPALISIITLFLIGNTGAFSKSLFSALVLTAVIAFSVVITFLSSIFLSKTVLSGENSSFILELPPYRKPQICKVIVRSVFDRTLFVLGRAVVSAIPAGLLLWFLANTQAGGQSLFLHFTQLLSPIGNALGLDGVILAAFILGFPANETVVPIMIMGYLSGNVLSDSISLMQIKDVLIQNGWDITKAINTIIFFLFHWPCATTMLTIYKETKSAKWTFLSFMLPTAIGVLLCLFVNMLF